MKKRIISIIIAAAIILTAIVTTVSSASEPTLRDALDILRYLAKLESGVEVSRENQPTIDDALEILKFLAGLPSVYDTVEAEPVEYIRITAQQAMLIMDSEDYILLDVRTQQEFDERHIDGAVLIPYDELNNRAANELTVLDALILIYCRSGRRSEIAANTLIELGYTNVMDFGGIIDWPYIIVFTT